jgi:hypothetical protein
VRQRRSIVGRGHKRVLLACSMGPLTVCCFCEIEVAMKPGGGNNTCRKYRMLDSMVGGGWHNSMFILPSFAFIGPSCIPRSWDTHGTYKSTELSSLNVM